MPLDPKLLGHETTPETGTIHREDIRRFADAVGDQSPIYRDADAATRAGYGDVPAMPTFVTRFRVPFAEAGLDPEHSQVLHGEQEYTYERPLVAGDTLTSRHRVATMRTAGGGAMTIMTLEQLGDDAGGTRVVTGRSTVIVREGAPNASAAQAGAARAKPAPVPQGERIPELTKHVTQEQIDAYAEVSGDHNPIHVNPDAAHAVGLEGTIAHGMLSMAFLGQLLTDWLASLQAGGGHAGGGYVARLRVRFQGMVRPGDTLTCRGALGKRAGERQTVDVWIDNQRGERVISGDADVVFAAS